MRKLPGCLAGVLLATTALPAVAADLIFDEIPVEVLPVTISSTGFYVGAHVGSAILGVDYDDAFFVPPEVMSFSAPSLTAGIAFGWDTMLGSNLVGGVELRYDFFGGAFSPYELDLEDLFRFQDTISATAKLGYLVAPGTQLYGVLGIGSAGVEAPEGFVFGEYASGRATGLVAGVGAESRITDQLSATVDARYFQALDAFVVDEIDYTPRYLAVTAGLKFRFDDGLDHLVAEPVQYDFDFTGPSISLSAIGAAGSMERDTITPGADVDPFWGQGVGVGLGFGYDFELDGTWVIGATANLDYVPMVFEDDSADSPDVAGTLEFASIDTIVSLGARIGAKLNPSTLLYGKLALAGINTHANEDFFATTGGGSEFLPGYQLGLGIETAIADQLTLGVEGTYTAATDALVTDNLALGQVELTPTLLAGKVTLKYHF